MHPLITLIAMALDAICGYPQWLFACIGHPVSWIGALIAWCEARWNEPQLSFTRRRLNGVLCLVTVVTVTAAICTALVAAAGMLPSTLGLLVLGALASTLIAQRSLHEHVS